MKGICLFLSLFFCANVLIANNQNLTKPIVVTKDKPVFKITLPSNPSTGYSWAIEGSYNANLIHPLTRKYIASNQKSMGSSGSEQWTFAVRKLALRVPTRLQLKFIYLRPWQNKSVKQEIVNVITVT